MERKDSIRRFLREQFRDDKKKDKEHKDKESKETKESKENKENIAAASSSTAAAGTAATANSVAASTESVKSSATDTKTKSSAYRLFRTVCMHLECILFHFNSFVSVCARMCVCGFVRGYFSVCILNVCRLESHSELFSSVDESSGRKMPFLRPPQSAVRVCWILLLCSPTNR